MDNITPSKPIKVTSFEHIIELCRQGKEDFFVQLNSCKSSKSIFVIEDDDTDSDSLLDPSMVTLSIFNDVDESTDEVTKDTIGSTTPILDYINQGCFYNYGY